MRFCALVALSCACGSASIEPVALPEPAPTFLMAFDGLVSIGTDAQAIKVTDVESSAVELALYSQPIAELGLTPGPLAEDAGCLSCALGEPAKVYRRAPLVGGAWMEQAGPSESLLSRVLPDAWPRCSCTNFVPQLVEIPAARGITVSTALEEPGGSVLLAIDDGSIVRVLPDLRIERLCREWGGVQSATLGRPGAVWVAHDDLLAEIVLDEQRSDAPCAPRTSTTTPAFARERLMYVGGAADWLIAVTRVGSVYTYDGRFVRVGDIGVPTRPVAVMLGPRSAAVSQEESDELHWLTGETLRSERVVPNDSIDAMALSPELGLVVVLELAGVAVREGPSWRMVGVSPWGGATKIIPYGRGLFTVKQSAVELSPKLEACPLIPSFSKEMVFRMARLGERDVILADIVSGDAGRPSAIGVLVATPWCTP